MSSVTSTCPSHFAETISAAAERFAGEVRERSFPGPEQTYRAD